MHEQLKGSAALQAADIPSHPYPGLAAWAKEEPALRASLEAVTRTRIGLGTGRQMRYGDLTTPLVDYAPNHWKRFHHHLRRHYPSGLPASRHLGRAGVFTAPIGPTPGGGGGGTKTQRQSLHSYLQPGRPQPTR